MKTLEKMKCLLCLSLFFSLQACSDDSSSCIEDMKQEFISQNENVGFTGIYTFEMDGNSFYIFDDGVAFDAVATVLDKDCNLICSFGGFRLDNDMPCDEYQEAINSAQQIWP